MLGSDGELHVPLLEKDYKVWPLAARPMQEMGNHFCALAPAWDLAQVGKDRMMRHPTRARHQPFARRQFVK